MFKKLRKNEKGFTLAELLIVVAIIGVLVAISIPIFTSQLEKAREATDLANIRSAYAECSAAVLTDTEDSVNTDATKGVVVKVDGTSKVVTATREVKLTQQVSGWTDNNGKDVAGLDISKGTATKVGASVEVKVDSKGIVTIADKTA